MKNSIKNTNYNVGQKVYYSDGIEEKYFRGIIIKNLKISVLIKKTNGEEESINKRNLGIVI